MRLKSKFNIDLNKYVAKCFSELELLCMVQTVRRKGTTMKKIMIAAMVAMLASVSMAELLTSINSSTTDQGWRTDGTSVWVGQTNTRVGTETANMRTALVLPFLLPALPDGHSITNISLSMYCEASNITSDYNFGMDVLGVRVSASSSTAFTDMEGTVINDNQYLYNVGVFVAGNTYTFSSAGMVAYLQSIYDNDPNAAGKYVFLTLAPDTANSTGTRYITFSTANNANVSQRPVLDIYTDVVPEPATTGMLGLGALITLLVRRMHG